MGLHGRLASLGEPNEHSESSVAVVRDPDQDRPGKECHVAVGEFRGLNVTCRSASPAGSGPIARKKLMSHCFPGICLPDESE